MILIITGDINKNYIDFDYAQLSEDKVSNKPKNCLDMIKNPFFRIQTCLLFKSLCTYSKKYFLDSKNVFLYLYVVEFNLSLRSGNKGSDDYGATFLQH